MLLTTVAEEQEGGEKSVRVEVEVTPVRKLRGLWGRGRSGSGSEVALMGAGAAAPSASSTASSLNTGMSSLRQVDVVVEVEIANLQW